MQYLIKFNLNIIVSIKISISSFIVTFSIFLLSYILFVSYFFRVNYIEDNNDRLNNECLLSE